MKCPRTVQVGLGVALFLTTAVAPVLAAEDDAIALKQELAEAKARIVDLKAKLAEILAEQAQLRARLAAREAELNKAVKQVEELTLHLQALTGQLGALKERQTRKEWHEPLRGKVKSVDKEAGTVVINMGERHKVKKGSAFIVFRGDQYVGKVVVDEVRADECTAHLDLNSMKCAPQAGDDVTTKLVIEL